MADCKIGEETRARLDKAWPALLDRVADGELIREAIKAEGFSVGEVRAYRALSTVHDADWQRAKEDSADAYFDEIRAMTNTRHSDAASARVNMDGLKWLAAKRNPRIYNDKATLDVNVKTVDLTRIIESAQARLAAAQAVGGRVLEHGAALALPELAAAQQIDDLL